MGKKGDKRPKKIKVPPFLEECKEFRFANGDRYVGNFIAHKSGVVWREGEGVYITYDDQYYDALWKDDQIMDNRELAIIYTNGDEYQGKLSKTKYQGTGFYKFSNGHTLMSNFTGNKPSIGPKTGPASLVLIDPTQKFFYGRGEDTYAILLPELIFYTKIDPDQGKGQLKVPKLNIPNKMTYNELRGLIFEKSTKTPTDIVFEDFHPITIDVDKPKMQDRLLERFFSCKYKNSCLPKRVFYPTVTQ